MQVMISFYEPVEIFASERDDAYWGAWGAYVGAIGQSGLVVSGAGLEPPAKAATLRLVGGERMVQDGPVLATKEQLGGFFILEVPDMETALAWAAKAPAATYGAVEVRPVLQREM